MTDDEAWGPQPERFRAGGQDRHREALDPARAMAFPAPTGIRTGADIARSLDGAPRWSSVTFADARIARPFDGLLVLACTAGGRCRRPARHRQAPG